MNEQDKNRQFLEEQREYVLTTLIDIKEYMERKDVTEIMLNQDGYIWIDTHSGTKKTDVKISDDKAQLIFKIMANFNNKATANSSIVSGILPTGDRFEGITGEASHYKTIFSIRKKSKRLITLDEYVNTGFITQIQKDFIIESIKSKKNILIIGGTSSGKTTFANACLDILKNSDDRIIILEDTDELQCSAPNTIKLKTTLLIEMIHLLQSSMRMNPTIIVVGELRNGKDTLELLKAWNSGHSGGISTIHADDCNGGLMKLKQYLYEEIETDMSLLIANSIGVVINIIKKDNRRYVREIKNVIGYNDKEKQFILEDITNINLKKGS